jgi:chromosome segregation ATPase
MQAIVTVPPTRIGLTEDSRLNTSIVSRTYGRIFQVLDKKKQLTQQQSQVIQQILMETFQEALQNEELLSLKDQYIEELETTNGQLAQKVSQVFSEHQILKNKFESLKTKTEELKQQYEELDQKHSATEKENASLKQETIELKQDYQDLTQHYDELKQKYSEINDQNGKLKEKSTSLEKEYTELLKNYEELEKENEVLKFEAKELSQKYSQLEKRYNGLDTKTQVLQSSFDKLNTDYSKLQTFVNQVIESNAKIQAEMERQARRTDELNDKVDSWSRNLSTLGQQVWDTIPEHLRILCYFGKKLLNANKSQSLSSK